MNELSRHESERMTRSFQWDLARQVERLDWLIAQLPRYADWGYDEVHLHLEDAVEYPSLPFVARRDAYSRREFGRLVEAATRAGIKVVPIVNLLGHTQYLIKTRELRDLNELRAEDGSPLERGQICPLHPRTIEVAEKLLRDMAPFCTAGKVHVGLDESFHLGKHPLSHKEIAEVGLAGHFARYVNRVHELTRSVGLRFGMWADMLYFLPDAIDQLPPGITAYEWYYHAFRRHPRVELFNFAEVDVATPLRRRGISLYGCPMNGAFRHEPLPHFGDRLGNIISWWKHCQRVGAEGFLVSSWEPHRLAIELTTAIDAAAATLWLEPEITDPREMLARGFARAFRKGGRVTHHAPLRVTLPRVTARIKENPPYQAWAKLALDCDQYPFTGYPRWEINERWDTVSRRESLAPYQREERFFAGLARIAAQNGAPVALRASIALRHYFALRDVWVREASRNGCSPEKLKIFGHALRSGLRAARTIWRRTRDSAARGPNEERLLADQKRMNACARGELVFGGEWQLCYSVWNFAPAAQLVGVEQQRADGTWQVLQACHTIEFQTSAARPSGKVIREHAAAVTWNGDNHSKPQLRIFVQGVGAVRVGRIELRTSDSVHKAAAPAGRSWRTLGRSAPRVGWPLLPVGASKAVLPIQFRV